MNLNRNNNKGFTLGELMMAVAIGSVILAATLIASVALQKSFNAVDNYFAAHVQQIRIVDYLSRDVKRSYIVTSTSSPQTVTCTVPDYLTSTGTRRSPTITNNANGITVDYRAVSDGVITNGSSTFTSATAGFSSADVGKALIGTGIPSGTTIQSYSSATTVVMSANATASTTGTAVTIGNSALYSINNQSILRTENGALTTIASSTDNLLPTSVLSNILLTNTEYLTTSITFLPIFTSGGATAERSGTTIYSTAYLRNKRRG
jgi:prepilin-type N-terminal cleavage/methylation domain-containing protein